LPKYQHVITPYSTDSPPPGRSPDKNTNATQNGMEADAVPVNNLLEEQQEDVDMGDVADQQLQTLVPMTMRELADATRQRLANGTADSKDLPSPSLLTNNANAGTKEALGSSKSTPTTRATSKPRNPAKKRARDESERPVANTQRVLRPRVSKSAAQIQEEREREHAYRRAVAE
jgi:xeroderma pigmentosum group C-complementing protein